MTTEEIKHEETCNNKTDGSYSIGCVGCIYQLVQDGKHAISLEIGDINKINQSEKQKYVDRLNFFMQLEKHLP